MSAQHTQGPWRAERTPASAYFDWTVMAPSGKGRTMQIGIDTDNTEADAHLIAASPDLLVALIAVMGRVPSDLERADSAMNTVMREARAAIAKATGQS